MGLKELLRREYHTIQMEIEQDGETKLPFYGPIIKGWFNHTLHDNDRLWKLIVRNPNVDVRPYFISTTNYDNKVIVNIKLLGFSEHYTREIVTELANNGNTHIGGVDCFIRSVRFEKRKFCTLERKRKYHVRFITPTGLYINDEFNIAPTLDTIVKSLVRSANRFSKYYLKKTYPIKVNNIDTKSEIDMFHINMFNWTHRNSRGKEIAMKGITGEIRFSKINVNAELKNILRLSDFFHIGKWNSYGFGSIEVS